LQIRSRKSEDRQCNAYHHIARSWQGVLDGSWQGVLDTTLKFVSDIREVSDFPPGIPVSSTEKTDHHDITEILLKVALSTINHNKPSIHVYYMSMLESLSILIYSVYQ
jgi:hypothetical protein